MGHAQKLLYHLASGGRKLPLGGNFQWLFDGLGVLDGLPKKWRQLGRRNQVVDVDVGSVGLRAARGVCGSRGPYPNNLFDTAGVWVNEIDCDGGNAADGQREARLLFAALNVDPVFERRGHPPLKCAGWSQDWRYSATAYGTNERPERSLGREM